MLQREVGGPVDMVYQPPWCTYQNIDFARAALETVDLIKSAHEEGDSGAYVPRITICDEL